MRNALYSVMIGIMVATTAIAADPQGGRWQETQPRYGEWRSDEDQLRELLDELKAMLRDARNSRAADPRFLRDLRKLVDRYDPQWGRAVFMDDFNDGNYTANPPWIVNEGYFWVEHGGLRSMVRERVERSSREDIGALIAGAILGGRESEQNTGHHGARESRRRAVIRTNVNVPNAFSMRTAFSSARAEGRLVFALYEDTHDFLGYRLVLQPAQSPSVRLVRVGLHGGNDIAVYTDRLYLDDQRIHQVMLSRNRAGDMTVNVDGKEVIKIRDTAVSRNFQGLMLANRGGDFTIDEIRINAYRGRRR